MRVFCNVGILLAAAMPAPAFSQDTHAGDQQGEIVVTAQKREQKLQDIILPAGRVADRDIPQAPSWSVGGLLRYEMDVLGGSLSAQTDWKYESSQYFSTFNAPVDFEKGRIYGNVRLSYTTGDEHWTSAFFVNNVTDKDYRLYNLDVSSAGASTRRPMPGRAGSAAA